MAPLSTSALTSPFVLRPSLRSHSLSSFHICVSAPAILNLRTLSSPFSRSRVLAVAAEEAQQDLLLSDKEEEGEEERESEGFAAVRTHKLYVSNLPRSCDVAHLLELFNPHGTINSVEVSRDPATGVSKGCGFVTMNSYLEARNAISALNGSDLEGREMLVKFSPETEAEMRKNKNKNKIQKDLVYESPYKIYIGNLAWSVKPEELREHFSKYGSVISSRLIHDRKDGKHRVYGFVSFSNDEEKTASIASAGTMLQGRQMMVRPITDENK